MPKDKIRKHGMGQSTAKANPNPDGPVTSARSPGPYVTRIPVGSEFGNGDANNSCHSPPKTEYVKRDPIKLIQDIIDEVEKLETEINTFAANGQDKQYRYLDEMLTRCMIRLDNIETEGKEDIRQARKRAINAVQQMVRILETKVGRRPAVEPSQDSNSNVQNEAVGDLSQDQLDQRQTGTPV